ncbi:hypothetical protein [Estrella lausannensis]|uniref:Putative membrane protein n=1 Tax=Estrella lausannensis TaxID=483423 RepID=A0A0H5DNZ1_9BACT|nr:hypothetical protein [Estrella lausannensis]CRX37568.1 putative membrane protein [Estrella lausannensis]
MEGTILIIAIQLLCFSVGYGCWKFLKYPLCQASNMSAQGNLDADNSKEPNEKIYNKWLQGFGLYYVGTLLYCIAIFLLGALTFEESMQTNNLVQIAGLVASTLVFGILMYLFAYMKKGTKWIGAFLLISPVLNLIDLIADPASLTEHTLLLAAYTYFWVCCKRLYDLNRSLKVPNRPEVASQTGS